MNVLYGHVVAENITVTITLHSMTIITLLKNRIIMVMITPTVKPLILDVKHNGNNKDSRGEYIQMSGLLFGIILTIIFGSYFIS